VPLLAPYRSCDFVMCLDSFKKEHYVFVTFSMIKVLLVAADSSEL
jgi:hypothetical protein